MSDFEIVLLAMAIGAPILWLGERLRRPRRGHLLTCDRTCTRDHEL